MVTISVECQCKTCKKTFLFVKECRNGFEAEKKEKWAKRHKDSCPDCYKASQQEEAIRKAEELGLPELIGRSEKQVQFAFSLRNRYIQKNEKLIQKAQAEIDKLNPQSIALLAQQKDMSQEDCVEEAFERVGLRKAYICLVEQSAQTIIDTFTH